MSFVDLAIQNLLSPVILFFVLGVGAALLRSDLEIPAPIGKGLSLYLMAAIGFKGGIRLAEGGGLAVVWIAVAAVVLSMVLPVIAFILLRSATRVSVLNAAAIAAHYGSVSVVTFVAAAAFLETQDVAFSGAMVIALALMETPAIVTGLLLARRVEGAKAPIGHALREALVNGSVLLLVGSLLIGWITGDRGVAMLEPVLITPFQGALAFFLLDMGLIAARRIESFRRAGWRLAVFGLYMPLIGAMLGLGLAKVLHLSLGDATLLTVLAASASYIAVPAAMRHALPKADAALYVPLSLAITFPFNVVIGIPLYHLLANAWIG